MISYPVPSVGFQRKKLRNVSRLNKYSLDKLIVEVSPGNVKRNVRGIWRSGAVRRADT